MKIISYNVNGIRAAIVKDLLLWLEQENPDLLLLQEIKALTTDISEQIKVLNALGYVHQYLLSAEKKGYSVVAILSKIKPLQVVYGCSNELYDREGRILRADFPGFSVMSVYFPSGSSGIDRQNFKFAFLDFFQTYINQLRISHPNLIIGGDFNICHRAIDIHNPKSNAKSSGFLPEERDWMEAFINQGFIDTFRHFNPDPNHYTWWSYRASARAKNLGWRIDYLMSTQNLQEKLQKSGILPAAKHSDHCPIFLEIAD